MKIEVDGPGIDPGYAVLKTAVLPLNYPPTIRKDPEFEFQLFRVLFLLYD